MVNTKSITILAIESSCDETAASIIVNGKILSNFIANQTVHEKFGGVVPELASRAHMENIVPVVDAALKKAFPENTPTESLAKTKAFGLPFCANLSKSGPPGYGSPNNFEILSKASPAASSMVSPSIIISAALLHLTICVCPPLTVKHKKGKLGLGSSIKFASTCACI